MLDVSTHSHEIPGLFQRTPDLLPVALVIVGDQDAQRLGWLECHSTAYGISTMRQ